MVGVNEQQQEQRRRPGAQPEQRRALDVPDGLPHGMYLGRVRNLEGAIARYGFPFTAKLTEHALLADEPGYKVFRDFKDKEKNASWRLLEQALQHGIDAVDDPAPSMVELFEELDRVPDWVDFDQLYRGAIAFWRAGPLVPMVLSWATIGAGFSMYSSTRPVLFSNRLADPEAAGPRLMESFRWIMGAYKPGGMDRFAPGFSLSVKVRLIHCAVRYTLSRSEHWDWEAWGIPINNLDAMNTQAGQFGWAFIRALGKLGVRFTDREIEDIIALSRYVGYVLGVPEEILHTDPEDALRKHEFHKMIEQPPDQACRDVINGILTFTASKPPYDVLPGPVGKFMTPVRRKRLAEAMIDHWLPEDVLEHLHFEKTAWRIVPKVMRPVVSAAQAVRERLPHDDERAAWKMVHELEGALQRAEEEKARELADVDELSRDIAANKGRVQSPAPRRSRNGRRRSRKAVAAGSQ